VNTAAVHEVAEEAAARLRRVIATLGAPA
jgi:hypothetical protein